MITMNYKSLRIKSDKSISSIDEKLNSSFSKEFSEAKVVTAGKPTPLDFDAFIPWVCLELQCPMNVIVTRINQEPYRRPTRESSSAKVKSKRFIRQSDDSLNFKKLSVTVDGPKEGTKTEPDSAINLTAYYNNHNRLVEISMSARNLIIHRKIIQALNLCLPFHSSLIKLSIQKGVTSSLLNEIAKLLPHSNLTDICLDDSNVSEGNYYVLLDQVCQLKTLSLARCGIDDGSCVEIATRLDLDHPNGSTLLILNLSSNRITDMGAKALGEILRCNRSILHLNMSGNQITDVGAIYILQHLLEFRINDSELMQKRRRRINYLQHKTTVYEENFKKIENQHRNSEEQRSPPLISKHGKHSRKSKKNASFAVTDTSKIDFEHVMAGFDDPFHEPNVVRRDSKMYAVGNLSISYLNLAYNDLAVPSVVKLHEVLKYQSEVTKPNNSLGLLRVLLDGNRIPKHCKVLKDIEGYLKNAVSKNAHLPPVSHTSILSVISKTGRKI